MNKSPNKRPQFQISIGFMMLMMVVCAVISAGFFYASRVPMIREELSMLWYGKSANSGEDVGRAAHKAFIMFTLASPLLLATAISTGMSILRWIENRK